MWVRDEVVVGGLVCGCEGKGKGEMQKTCFWQTVAQPGECP